MKKPSVHFRNYRLLAGTSLIELLIVLGISAMILAGSFVWFSSKRVTDFADNTRQIESLIRQAQNEINTNSVPGYDSSNSACNNGDATRSACVLQANDQVLASGVGINSGALGTNGVAPVDTRTLVFYYFKVGPHLTAPANTPLAAVSAYSTRKVVLPAGLRFAWVKVFGRSGTSCSTVNKDYIDPNTTVGATQPGWSVVTFRRDPGIMNSFSGTGPSNLIAVATGTEQLPKPPFGSTTAYTATTSSSDPRWYPSWGGDNPSNYTAGTDALPSLPCAVMWRVESDEKVGANARFTAEVVFNLETQKITVQRR
jgi:type II secretory pathway pseudopilin PulG